VATYCTDGIRHVVLVIALAEQPVGVIYTSWGVSRARQSEKE